MKNPREATEYSEELIPFIPLHWSFALPNKLEYKTVLYYKVLLRYKTVFFGTISVQTSILLYKTVFYRVQNYVAL
jgi:hypothetical protein